MAFPSGWSRKCPITIDASMVTGDIVYDLIVLLDQRAFPTEMITGGGGNACQEGGGDLRFSADDAGVEQLACEITRCELDPTPDNSRVMCYVRVPNVSDTVDTTFYVWYSNSVATMPDADDPYGMHNVWNSSDLTAPTFYHVYHFNDDPTGPQPPFSDSSTSGDGTYSSATLTTCEGSSDGVPGRGIDFESIEKYIYLDDGVTTVPGTGDFSVLYFTNFDNAVDAFYGWQEYDDDTFFTYGNIYYSPWTNFRVCLGNINAQNTFMIGDDFSGNNTIGFARDGDDVDVFFRGDLITTYTGFAAANVGASSSRTRWLQQYHPINDAKFYEIWFFAVAINSYYNQVLYRNFTDLSTYISAGTPEAAAIEAEIYFDGLHAGSEVRVYEVPHAQIWTCECVGDVLGSLGGTYMTFEVQNASDTTSYYAWFDVDDGYVDPAPAGRTGIEVDISMNDSAEDVASALSSAIDGYGNMTATVSSDIVTITNLINGETSEPLDVDTGCTVTVIQLGGTSIAEIDGIEVSTGSSWTATYQVLRPRRCLIVIHSIYYSYIRYQTVLSLAGLLVPAGVLQRYDRNYST